MRLLSVKQATYICWAIALATGILYTLAAARAGLGSLAVWGGFLWVTLLALIITLPVVIPLARRSGRAGELGGVGRGEGGGGRHPGG